MNSKTFIAFSTAIFAIIALGHLTRVIYTWDVTIEGFAVPVWVSGIVVLIAGIMVTNGLRFLDGNSKKKR